MIDNKEFESTRDIAQVARDLFADAPLTTRTIQSLRSYICPFYQLIPLVPRGSTVLDFGCGNGLFLGLLAVSGRIVEGVGIDVSDRAIATAKTMRHGIRDDISLRFECRTSFEEFTPRSLDVVSMIDVMHHIPPPQQERTLINLLTLLKPGGLFLYKDIAAKPLWRAFANRMHDLLMAKQWIHYYPISEVHRIAVEHGMVVREEAYITQFWYGHDLLLTEKSESANNRAL